MRSMKHHPLCDSAPCHTRDTALTSLRSVCEHFVKDAMQHIINNFLQKRPQVKSKYFAKFIIKYHENCLHLSSLLVSDRPAGCDLGWTAHPEMLHSETSGRFWSPGKSFLPTSGKAAPGEAQGVSGREESLPSPWCMRFLHPERERERFSWQLQRPAVSGAVLPVGFGAVCLAGALFLHPTLKS